ncbi:MAG: hypothetical protein VX643_01585 [Chloroflexota bacterium]|nr:hypothetical protein [Chloroflexota bacterium]
MSDYIYLVQMDIPAEFEDEFNRVYDTQHVPNITKAPGVSACTRYKLESTDVEGVARYAAVYAIDTPDIPETHGWKLESEKGDWPTKIRPNTLNRSHHIFKKLG